MLSTHQLSCIRGDRTLFADLSFTLSSGQLLHVKGPNGSGKTTLLRTVCGLFQPQHGSIQWNKTDIKSLDEDYRSQLLYLGHQNGIKDDLSAVENLVLVSRLEGTDLNAKQIEQALDKMGLVGFEDLPTKMLSQGQKRRVALARLLVSASPLWVLDEPFVSLDVDAIDFLQSVIAEKIKNGGMVLLTTHQHISLASGEIRELNLGSPEAAG